MALRGSASYQKILQISQRSFSSAICNGNGASADSLKGNKHQTNKLHITAKQQYPVAAALPLPQNIDPSETTRFSPQRARDISATAITSHQLNLSNAAKSQIDITVDNSSSYSPSRGPDVVDPHVPSYDCFGAVSLNAVMQSQVPNPFGGMHKFTHLNMPGGQWSQEGKFMSQNLHESHYTNLRRGARSDWCSYDEHATVPQKPKEE